MVKDCQKEILNCIIEYELDLRRGENVIKDVLVGNKISFINDVPDLNSISCNKSLFEVGSECEGTKYKNNNGNDYSYNESKNTIEGFYAKNVVESLKKIVEEKISNDFLDYKRVVESIKPVFEAVKEGAREEDNMLTDIKQALQNILNKLHNVEEKNLYKAEAYRDIIKDFYENRDIGSTLRCSEISCFNKLIDDKLSELSHNKDVVLENVNNIFKHIQVDDKLPDTDNKFLDYANDMFQYAYQVVDDIL
ncbi:hypothetical protein [Wolbachia endosymbiont of Chironomus riparius]|uniref:hypothetical protein n=1 Tax=Wolbachia endosymbiont of Chironomus riparius TaxID=2883238 RepID=UPI00209FA91E|nr:hypothetical protein [Wolbachia endosymbiont of Chironomus riparius]